MGSVLFLLGGTAGAQDAKSPRPEDLLAANTHSFEYTESALTGSGAELLRAETADRQFVLLGEAHMDHAIPVFAGALFRLLHQAHGFRYLVVEQDPVAMEEAQRPGVRGDAERIAVVARKYPSLFEFDTDEDLAFLALVGKLAPQGDAIWGVEQSTGAGRYLEELVSLAPNPTARKEAEALLAEARAADPGPKYSVNWLIEKDTPAKLAALTKAFAAKPGSRASRLLAGLTKSAEIFGYYRRAEAGEFVGLFNNTVREEVLKANFLAHYRAAATGGRLPRAMFKFGANHLYHGKNPTQAFPIGNLAHEFAIANGMSAYGIYVLPLGEGYSGFKDFPAWMRPLLPATEPGVPTLVNLRALRPYQRLFREKVAPADQWQLRDFINGYDALVLLPNSRPATRKLGGRDE